MGPGHTWLFSLSYVGEAAKHPTLEGETEGQSGYGRPTRGHTQGTKVRPDTNIQLLRLQPGGMLCMWLSPPQSLFCVACVRQKCAPVPAHPSVY